MGSEDLNKELAKLRKKVAEDTGDESLEAYLEGFEAGYNKAKAERADKKSTPNELEEPLNEWSEKQE